MDQSVESDELFARRRVGELVGPYRLEQVLGVGGMAAVYLGRAHDGSVAAVKILHPEMSVRPDVRERFYREGYVANSIQHPGVVRVLSHGEAQQAYLAMELLSGETLSDRVRRHGQLPIPELLDMADQVLDVLSVAHERGIVHRDLKPDNLFVTSSNTIKILDFGLARLSEAAPSDHRTRTGVALGTLPYMAPEQALGRLSEIDGRVDLFALGATLFRILTGRRVHEGNSEAELLIAMASKPAPPLASLRPDLPPELCRVVDLALAFSRDARYPDARTMQADVRALRYGGAPPYATARFSQREQKTRAEPALDLAPPSYGPQGTVPIAIHRGAPLGQTYPSAHAAPVPAAGRAAVAPSPPAAFSTTASGQSLNNPALGRTNPDAFAQTYPAAGAGPALAQTNPAAFAQPYPAAGVGAALGQTNPAALGQTNPAALPVGGAHHLGGTSPTGAGNAATRRTLIVALALIGVFVTFGVLAAIFWVMRAGGAASAASSGNAIAPPSSGVMGSAVSPVASSNPSVTAPAATQASSVNSPDGVHSAPSAARSSAAAARKLATPSLSAAASAAAAPGAGPVSAGSPAPGSSVAAAPKADAAAAAPALAPLVEAPPANAASANAAPTPAPSPAPAAQPSTGAPGAPSAQAPRPRGRSRRH